MSAETDHDSDELSAIYREGAGDLPGAELDAEVLDAARRAVRPWYRKPLTGGIASALVAALALSLFFDNARNVLPVGRDPDIPMQTRLNEPERIAPREERFVEPRSESLETPARSPKTAADEVVDSSPLRGATKAAIPDAGLRARPVKREVRTTNEARDEVPQPPVEEVRVTASLRREPPEAAPSGRLQGEVQGAAQIESLHAHDVLGVEPTVPRRPSFEAGYSQPRRCIPGRTSVMASAVTICEIESRTELHGPGCAPYVVAKGDHARPGEVGVIVDRELVSIVFTCEQGRWHESDLRETDQTDG